MKPIKDQTGAVLVEFVLVLPLLILFVFASIEFGVAFFDKAMITNASRVAARAGIVWNEPEDISDDVITAIAKDYCKTHLITFGEADESDFSVVIGRRAEEAEDFRALTVTVSYKYSFLVVPNILRLIIPGSEFPFSITMGSESVMRMEKAKIVS